MPRALFLVCFAALFPTQARAADAGAEFFEKQVRPLLVEHCLKCHGDKKPRGKLVMTSRAGLLKGGESGPAVVPGKPEKSPLVQALHYVDPPRMPPKEKLAAGDIATLTRWVKMGAPWPESPARASGGGAWRVTEEQRRFWSLQPVRAAAPPAVKATSWARNPIDRFILARLEAKGLAPAGEAGRRALVRRLTYDLTGLPPAVEEVEAFVADRRVDAYERLVDRLLASPGYGERWGRHWLDLVRYTDSFDARVIGNEMDCQDAWRYRDWVVGALNADKPYDRFMMEQVAGDVLAGGFDREGVVATGLLAIGNWGGGDADKEKLLTDIVDDQIDVVSKAFLGLTVSCARCHDHKFDPISTQDYYGLAGIFFSTHILPNVGPKTNGPPMLRIPLAGASELERRRRHGEELKRLAKELEAARRGAYAAHAKASLKDTARYLLAAYDVQRGEAVEAVGKGENLYPYALRKWQALLSAGDYRPLAGTYTEAVGGRAGVRGWRNEAECPNAVVNTTGEAQAIATFRLPARSVAVHPGPRGGVVVAWQSPVRGKVRLSGRVSDADSQCGDGVEWVVEHRGAGGLRPLASGRVANGGAQALAGKALEAVAVEVGDRLELVILPGGAYDCDTTVVELTVGEVGGKGEWGLAREVVADPKRAGKVTWHFLDAGARGAKASGGLSGWHRAVAAARAGKADRKALREAAEGVAKGFTRVDEGSPFWPGAGDEGHLPAAVRAELGEKAARLAGLRQVTFAPLEYANGAQEGGVPGSPHAGAHDVRVHVRGRYDRLGEVVPRRFPEVLAGGKPAAIQGGSGRRELARWLARPEGPLPARVMVNRLWQHHFGRGIVNTPSNFGLLGERPTHPELLDWLAAELVRGEWSLKRMHRLIVLSATYRQGGEGDARTVAEDPDNLLFGRVGRRRLEAEALRDGLLAVAGALDRRQGGPATRDFGAPRRSLYLMTVRSEGSGFGPLFDVADSTAPVEKRTVSTVAPQALFLMNNAFVTRQAEALAARLRGAGRDDGERVESAYRLLYGRPPDAEERRLGVGYLRGGAGRWADYARVLMCANEMVFVD